MVRRSSDKVFKKLDKKIKEREEAGPFGTPGQKPKKKKSSKRPAKKPAKKEDLLKSLKIRKVSKHDQTFFKKGLEFFRMFYQKIKKQKIKKVLEEKILVDLLKRKKRRNPQAYLS